MIDRSRDDNDRGVDLPPRRPRSVGVLLGIAVIVLVVVLVLVFKAVA
jgi:hypothetical protein